MEEATEGRETPVAGRGIRAVLVVLLVPMLALGTLVGCGGEEGESSEALDDSAPLAPEEASSVTVRVSGTEGTAYMGDYGTFTGEFESIEDTLEAEPTEFEVEGDVAQGITAFFRKTEPGGEKLKVEILGDDQTIIESTTYADMGEASVIWQSPNPDFGEPFPEGAPIEEGPLEEPPTEEEIFEEPPTEEESP